MNRPGCQRAVVGALAAVDFAATTEFTQLVEPPRLAPQQRLDHDPLAGLPASHRRPHLGDHADVLVAEGVGKRSEGAVVRAGVQTDHAEVRAANAAQARFDPYPLRPWQQRDRAILDESA